MALYSVDQTQKLYISQVASASDQLILFIDLLIQLG
jgi:hypothetical protein